MKTQDIKNMGLALQQVQEKILTKKDKEKALAKAARTAKPKDQVTLPKAPFDIPKKGANEAYKVGQTVKPTKGPHAGQDHEVIHVHGDGSYNIKPKNMPASRIKYRQGAAKAKHDELKENPTNEALKGDQHKLDHDKDGDIDAADFKGLRNKKKKGEKAEVKPRQETETDKGKEAPMEKTESTKWPIYARIMEKKSHTAGATPPEEMDSKDSPTAKKMKADHKPEVNDTEAKSHQDAADAGRKGPNGQARPNDQQKGDKKIVNPVQGAVTSGSN